MTVTHTARPGQSYSPRTGTPANSAANAPTQAAPSGYAPAVHSLTNFSTGPVPSTAIPPPGLPLAKRPLFTPKVVLWSMMGLLAIAYMGTMLVAPALLEELAPTTAFITDPQSNQGQRAAARLVSDVNGLKESMAQVQLELSKVKTEIATSADQSKAMGAQLMALEQRLAQTTGSTLDAAEPQAGVNEGQRSVTAPKSVSPPEARASAGGAVGSPQLPRLVNATPANGDVPAKRGMETGSVSQAAKSAATTGKAAKATAADLAVDPIDFGSPVVTPAAAPIAVQISSGASVDSLRLSWSLLADRHADSLKELQPRYVIRGDAGNPTYDLIAGPIKSKTEARRLCKALTAQNVPCTVADYIGAAL